MSDFKTDLSEEIDFAWNAFKQKHPKLSVADKENFVNGYNAAIGIKRICYRVIMFENNPHREPCTPGALTQIPRPIFEPTYIVTNAMKKIHDFCIGNVSVGIESITRLDEVIII